MEIDKKKIEIAKDVLLRMANGVDPLTGEVMSEDSFLNNPKIIRCFYFISEILDNVMINRFKQNFRLANFIITPEQKNKVVLPDGKIGVNEFSKHINMHIDFSTSKKLTGVELNKRLKKIGILSDEKNPVTGKMHTITNPSSYEYGFETEKRLYNGAEYDAIVMNDKGKRYLLDNLESIMNIDVSSMKELPFD